jgi:hypothetical protein
MSSTLTFVDGASLHGSIVSTLTCVESTAEQTVSNRLKIPLRLITLVAQLLPTSPMISEAETEHISTARELLLMAPNALGQAS